MVFDKILSLISDRVLRFMAPRIAFWADQLYVLSYSDGRFDLKPLSAEERPNYLVLVVAREHYFETVKNYPIGNISDLKGVLSQNLETFPYEGEKFEQLEILSGQSSRVTSWLVKDTAYSGFDKRPLVLIPETAAISAISKSPGAIYSRLGRRVRLAKSADGISSMVDDVVPTGSAGEHANSANLAKYASLSEVQEEPLGSEQFALKLIQGSWALIREAPLRFRFRARLALQNDWPWRPAAKTVGLILIGYLALTSAYIVISDHWLDRKVETLTSKIAPVNKTRQSIADLQSQLNVIDESLQSIQPNWVIGDIVLDLIKQGASIRSLRSEGSSVVLFLDAPRATEVFSFLTQDKRIKEAEYAFPVQQRGSQQRFAVKITLSDQLLPVALEGNSDTSGDIDE